MNVRGVDLSSRQAAEKIKRPKTAAKKKKKSGTKLGGKVNEKIPRPATSLGKSRPVSRSHIRPATRADHRRKGEEEVELIDQTPATPVPTRSQGWSPPGSPESDFKVPITTDVPLLDMEASEAPSPKPEEPSQETSAVATPVPTPTATPAELAALEDGADGPPPPQVRIRRLSTTPALFRAVGSMTNLYRDVQDEETRSHEVDKEKLVEIEQRTIMNAMLFQKDINVGDYFTEEELGQLTIMFDDMTMDTFWAREIKVYEEEARILAIEEEKRRKAEEDSDDDVLLNPPGRNRLPATTRAENRHLNEKEEEGSKKENEPNNENIDKNSTELVAEDNVQTETKIEGKSQGKKKGRSRRKSISSTIKTDVDIGNPDDVPPPPPIPNPESHGEISVHTFVARFGNLPFVEDPSFKRRLVGAIDRDKSGSIDILEFFRIAAILLKGTMSDQVSFFFRLWDTGAKGYLDNFDMRRLFWQARTTMFNRRRDQVIDTQEELDWVVKQMWMLYDTNHNKQFSLLEAVSAAMMDDELLYLMARGTCSMS